MHISGLEKVHNSGHYFAMTSSDSNSKWGAIAEKFNGITYLKI